MENKILLSNMKTKRERVKLIELFHQRHADFSGKKIFYALLTVFIGKTENTNKLQ